VLSEQVEATSGRRVAEDVAEHQDGSLAGRQVLQAVMNASSIDSLVS
jgi:hypothetical protein